MAETGTGTAAGPQAVAFELALPANHAGQSLGFGDGGVVWNIVVCIVGYVVIARSVFHRAAIGICIIRRAFHSERDRELGVGNGR